MQSLMNKWSVMSRRVGQANSDQSHVNSQQATYMCLIRVPKKSVTRLLSTNHKWNRMRDSRALECGFCKNMFHNAIIGIAQQKYMFVPIYFPIMFSPCNLFLSKPLAAQLPSHIVKVHQPLELDYLHCYLWYEFFPSLPLHIWSVSQ